MSLTAIEMYSKLAQSFRGPININFTRHDTDPDVVRNGCYRYAVIDALEWLGHKIDVSTTFKTEGGLVSPRLSARHESLFAPYGGQGTSILSQLRIPFEEHRSEYNSLQAFSEAAPESSVGTVTITNGKDYHEIAWKTNEETNMWIHDCRSHDTIFFQNNELKSGVRITKYTVIYPPQQSMSLREPGLRQQATLDVPFK